MLISIDTNELVFGIKKRSEAELTTLFPLEADRYKFAIGTEKNDMLYRAIERAKAELDSAISRFLVIPEFADELSVTAPVDDNYLPETLTFDFRDSRRTTFPMQSAISSFCYESLVELSLANFYAKVGAAELSTEHDRNGAVSIESLTTILFRKRSPLD